MSKIPPQAGNCPYKKDNFVGYSAKSGKADLHLTCEVEKFRLYA